MVALVSVEVKTVKTCSQLATYIFFFKGLKDVMALTHIPDKMHVGGC